MTREESPTLTWKESREGPLIGTANLDDGREVQYICRNEGDDHDPKWKHSRLIENPKDRLRSIEYINELKGGENAQTRMRSILLCMKDLRELAKTI